MSQNGVFFLLLGTLKTRSGNSLGDAHERPKFGPKNYPHQLEGFLLFFGARRRTVSGLARASP